MDTNDKNTGTQRVKRAVTSQQISNLKLATDVRVLGWCGQSIGTWSKRAATPARIVAQIAACPACGLTCLQF